MATPPSEVLISKGWDVTDTGCWEYRGRVDSQGYGRYAHTRLHRVAYELANGPIPSGMLVRHTCDNRICVNPEHLILGTHRDNVHDMIDRGRAAFQRQTACKKGHVFDEKNTRQLRRSGGRTQRSCRTCELDRVHAYRARKRAA